MKELKVYVLDCSLDEEIGFDFRTLENHGEYEKIMDEAERRGSVYSLEYFQDEMNDENLSLNNAFILIR